MKFSLKSIQLIYEKISQSMSKHPLIWFIAGIIIGIAIGTINMLIYGIQIGNANLYFNSTCLIIEGPTSEIHLC